MPVTIGWDRVAADFRDRSLRRVTADCRKRLPDRVRIDRRFDQLPHLGPLAPGRATGDGPITRIAADGTGNIAKYPRVDSTGQRVVYNSTTDDDGLNPDLSHEVFRARLDGTLVERLTASPYWSFAPDVSANGDRIVFASFGDLTGGNPDQDRQIFLYEASTQLTTQLTSALPGFISMARISDDGAYVYFATSSPIFELEPGGSETLYRLEIDSGEFERASGPPDLRGVFDKQFQTPTFAIDAGSPTVLSWTPDPRYVRYDVIRGNVASISSLPGGSSVDLGAVTCLREDSPDPGTGPVGDPAEPLPGQVFFFLYRGTQGALDGPGSWGRGTIGERQPSSGSCDP